MHQSNRLVLSPRLSFASSSRTSKVHPTSKKPHRVGDITFLLVLRHSDRVLQILQKYKICPKKIKRGKAVQTYGTWSILSPVPVSPGSVLATVCPWRGPLTRCVWPQSLSHCELITDDGIRHLGNGACAHDRLEVIELDNCPLITDASLEHLKSCHSLERIELYDCQQITRAGIKRLRVKKRVRNSNATEAATRTIDPVGKGEG